MTPVTVTTEHQSTTFTLLEQLLPLLGILGVVVCVGGVVASRWLGWRGPVLLVGGVVSVIAVLTAEAYWGTRGGLLAAGLVLLPWVVLVARQWFHHGALSTRDIDRSILERVIERVYALLFWVVDGIDHCIDLLIGLGHTGVRAIRALSVRSLLSNPLAAVVSGLGRLGGQLVAARWMILVGTAVLGLLISGYVVGDVIGLLVTAGGLMVALIWYLQSSAGSSGDTTAHSQPPDQGGEGSSIPGHDREQFRELWRSFAQKVRGDRWESSTPGEIQREAIAAGYPAHPVDTLSETFRAVEYGDRPLTASVYEHARIAYRSVAFWHEKDDGGDNS